MIGYINKITAQTGQRDEVMRLIVQGSGNMAGCHSYVVAADAANPVDIWITEIWENEEAHEASLKIPEVRQSIEQAMPLIAGFESVATTIPASG